MKVARAGDWVVDVILPGVSLGMIWAVAGLLLGGALQLLLHLFGVGPRLSDNHTDWYIVVPGLLGAGAGFAHGVHYGLRERSASGQGRVHEGSLGWSVDAGDASEQEVAGLKQEIEELRRAIAQLERDVPRQEA